MKLLRTSWFWAYLLAAPLCSENAHAADRAGTEMGQGTSKIDACQAAKKLAALMAGNPGYKFEIGSCDCEGNGGYWKCLVDWQATKTKN